LKATNLLVGVIIGLLAYGLTIPAIDITIPIPYVGNVVTQLPNPFYSLGQQTLFKVPVWVIVGLIGVFCFLSAFMSDKPSK